MRTHPSEVDDAERSALKKMGLEAPPVHTTGRDLLILLASLAAFSFLFWSLFN